MKDHSVSTPFSKKMSFIIWGVVLALNGFVCIGAFFHWFENWWGFHSPQEIALAILVITSTLWISEIIPLFVTSFVILFLELVWLFPAIHQTDIKITQQDFLSPFFSDIILLFLGGFVLSSLLQEYKLNKIIAYWILKKTGESPKKFLFGIILVCAFLSMWMSNTATAAMMFTIILPIIQQIPEENPFARAVALSIPFACNLGGIGTPIGTPSNAIAVAFLAKSQIQISFVEWMLFTVPFMILFLIGLWWLLLKLFPPGGLKLQFELEAQKKLTKKQWLGIFIFIFTGVGWVTTQYHGLSAGTVSLIPIVICFGGKLLDVEDFRALSWDILLMLGGGLALGVGLEKSGLTSAIVLLIPKNASPQIILFCVLFLTALLTTFISNTATANLMFPLVVALSQEVGVLVLATALMCSTSMSLPISTPTNAIAFGSGILEAKHMIFPGFLISVAAFLLICFVGPYYWAFVNF